VSPRAEQFLPCPFEPPNHRPWCLTPFMWGRGGQPRATAHGLGGGGFRGGTGTGGGGLWPPGHFPSKGCLCDAGEPPLSGELDKIGRRVRPVVGLRRAGPLWANPPFSRLEEVVAKAAREGCLMLIIAPGWPDPNTRGGPHYVPFAPGGGSSHRTGPSTSGVART